jgi:serralysin
VIHNGALVVADGAVLDYETATSHQVTVRVSDGHGGTFDQNFTIQVSDVDETSHPIPPAPTPPQPPEPDLVIVGSGRTDWLNGRGGNDRLSGLGGNDKLYGGAGNDILSGGLGKDGLTGGAGADVFVFSGKLGKQNVDSVRDFSVADDTFHLVRSIFKAAGRKGELKKDAFVSGAKAKDAEDRIIYDSKKGKLFYDMDGKGDHDAVQIATLSKGLKLSYHDFFVV